MVFPVRRAAVAVALLLLVSGLAFSQSPLRLTFDTAVSATLGSGDEHWYSLYVEEPGLITVRTTGDTDTYMEAYFSPREGRPIAENDDGDEDLNARISLAATAGMTYYFKVRGYDSDATGPYRILASVAPVTALPLNTELTGYLDDQNDGHWYSVRASQTGLVTVQTTGETDTLMHALDSGNKDLAFDDDSGEGLNALVEVAVEAGKTYFFKVTAYRSGGHYGIRANFEATPPEEHNTTRETAIRISSGDAIPISFRPGSGSRWYYCTIPSPNVILTVQTRGNTDTLLSLYDARFNEIASDDDSGEDLNASITRTLSAGTVYIEVKPYSSSSRGRTTLHLSLYAEIR